MAFTLDTILAQAFAAGAASEEPTSSDPEDSVDVFKDINQGGAPSGSGSGTVTPGGSSYGSGDGLLGELGAAIGGDLDLGSLLGLQGLVDGLQEDLVAIADPGQQWGLSYDELALLTGQDLADLEPGELAQLFREKGSQRELPMGEVAQLMFGFDQEKLTLVQQKLFASGYFGSLDYDEVRWGTAGPETIDAFDSLLKYAARFRNDQGERLSWSSLLDQLVMAEGGLDEALGQAVEQSGPRITLQDPAAISQTLDAVWQRNTGRKAPSAAKRKFVAMMYGLQQQSQVAAQTGTGGTVVSPNTQAQAQQFADEQAGTETLGYQTLSAFNGLIDMIGGA
jgi:YD repeat-containing protein